jgi:hypothetical protein
MNVIHSLFNLFVQDLQQERILLEPERVLSGAGVSFTVQHQS